MNLAKIIATLNFKKLFSLFGLCITRPLYIIPSYTATKQCVTICDTHFGKTHHKNGKANAFRHALWNALIMHNNMRWGRSVVKAAAWAKKITDWHEEFSPNAPLERAMDLHNNHIGRTFVQKYADASQAQITQGLMELLPLSRKLNTEEELAQFKDQLVYIEDV